MSTTPSTPAQAERDSWKAFETWFAKYWAGDDPEDPNPVPFTGDWLAYAQYESRKALAWNAWNAGRASL